jgi:hypothetical protein
MIIFFVVLMMNIAAGVFLVVVADDNDKVHYACGVWGTLLGVLFISLSMGWG